MRFICFSKPSKHLSITNQILHLKNFFKNKRNNIIQEEITYMILDYIYDIIFIQKKFSSYTYEIKVKIFSFINDFNFYNKDFIIRKYPLLIVIQLF